MPRGKANRRPNSFTFRCSRAELDVIERIARADDRSLASMVRKLVIAEARRLDQASASTEVLA
jgi:hypothetical protein